MAYQVICARNLDGWPTPPIKIQNASLNKVLDILLDSWFAARLVEDTGDRMEFTAYCLNAVDTFYVTGENLSYLRRIYERVEDTSKSEGSKGYVMAYLIFNYLAGECSSPDYLIELKALSHKVLVAILCLLIESEATLDECLELAALKPKYDTFGRITGLE